MDDAISRQAVLKLLATIPPEEAMTKAMLIQSVKQMDAAQPEIIRCRECKWWDRCPSSTIAPLYHLCRRVGRMNMTADDFCSRAEQWEVSE